MLAVLQMAINVSISLLLLDRAEPIPTIKILTEEATYTHTSKCNAALTLSLLFTHSK